MEEAGGGGLGGCAADFAGAGKKHRRPRGEDVEWLQQEDAWLRRQAAWLREKYGFSEDLDEGGGRELFDGRHLDVVLDSSVDLVLEWADGVDIVAVSDGTSGVEESVVVVDGTGGVEDSVVIVDGTGEVEDIAGYVDAHAFDHLYQWVPTYPINFFIIGLWEILLLKDNINMVGIHMGIIIYIVA